MTAGRFLALISHVAFVGAEWGHGNCVADRPGLTYRALATQTVDECHTSCLNFSRCKSWSFNNCSATPKCQLKEAISQLQPWPSIQAGVCYRASGLKLKQDPRRRLKYTALPIGAIAPQGWLDRQLVVMAEGLSGHLDLFWPFVQNSVRHTTTPNLCSCPNRWYLYMVGLCWRGI